MGHTRISSNQLKLIGKWLLTLSLLFFFVFYIKAKFPKYIYQHKIERINLVMPRSFSYIKQLEIKPQTADLQQIAPLIRFYQVVKKHFPQETHAYSMLGYFYFHIDKYNFAKKYFELAYEQRPHNFWNSYNLGVIALQQRDYVKAREHFNRARLADIAATYQETINSTIIYRLIFEDYPEVKANLNQRLKIYYQNSIILSDVLSKPNHPNEINKIISRLSVRNF